MHLFIKRPGAELPPLSARPEVAGLDEELLPWQDEQ